MFSVPARRGQTSGTDLRDRPQGQTSGTDLGDRPRGQTSGTDLGKKEGVAEATAARRARRLERGGAASTKAAPRGAALKRRLPRPPSYNSQRTGEKLFDSAIQA
jgi:hypothetical protein